MIRDGNGPSGYAALPDRGILAIGGEDRHAFLQGLVSNDVDQTREGRAIYAAFLTPQGKYLHDFLILEKDDTLFLDCERDRIADLQRRLKIYKLRSRVTIEDVSSEFRTMVVFGPAVFDALAVAPTPGARLEGLPAPAFVDPRTPALGVRVLLPDAAAGSAIEETLERHGLSSVPVDAYETLRIGLCVPDGSRDLVIEKSILLENNFDALNGVSWTKGCYIGQELTARTKYRALIRKRLMPVMVDGPLPPPGTPVLAKDREIGEIRTGNGDIALALLRLEDVERARIELTPLIAGAAKLTPQDPS